MSKGQRLSRGNDRLSPIVTTVRNASPNAPFQRDPYRLGCLAHTSRSLARLRQRIDSRMVASMNSEDVAELYRTLDQTGIAIWIDGGWAVDAVARRQTRSHNDLDIAVEARTLDALRQFLAERGYYQTPSRDASKWNFVLEDQHGRKIDVHVAVLDRQGGVWADAIDGIAYPAGSLTGEGVIAGTTVRCISAELQLRFKTSYPPRAIDLHDVAVLCRVLGRPVPDTHKQVAP